MKKSLRFICLVWLVVMLIPIGFVSAQSFDYEGEWVCVSVDMGDGILLTEYESSGVGDIMRIQLNGDATLMVTSLGENIPGTWEGDAQGVSAVIDGQAVRFDLKEDQLVNSEDGITAYLEKVKAEPKPGGLLSLVKGNKYLGKWVSKSIDEGDGILKGEYEGMQVADLMTFQINRDGTLVMTSFGIDSQGTWQEITGGIRVMIDNQPVDMIYADNGLIAKTEGVTIYFVRAGQASPETSTLPQVPFTAPVFAGRWEAIRYETMGYTFDIKILFPDGGALTLREDGSGEAFITKDYQEPLTWSEKEGNLSIGGSYVLSQAVWNGETEELAMFYGSSAVVVYFRKVNDASIATVESPAMTAPVIEQTAVPSPVPTEQPSPTPSPEPVQSQEPVQSSGEIPLLCETSLFKLSLFGEGWKASEGWNSDSEDYGAINYSLNDSGGSTLASVYLTASNEGVRNYRDKIKTLTGYAQEAGKDSLDQLEIGGIIFSGIAYDKWGWKYLEYAARVPESRITILLTVEEPDTIGNRLQPILDSISFTLPVLTPVNIDPPLPEDGERYVPKGGKAKLGDMALTSSWLKTDRPIIVDSIFDNHITYNDGKLYVLAGKMLYAYTMEEGKLLPDTSFAGGQMELTDEFEYLSSGKDNTLFVSQGIFNILAVRDGVIIEDNNIPGFLAMHPDGEWGITFWVNTDPKLVRVSEGKLTQEPWVLTNLYEETNREGRFSSISCVAITKTHIYAAGTDATKGDAQRVSVMDMEGKELFTFGAEDWSADDAFGSVTGIVETKEGILVQDGNYSDYKLFSHQGEYIGHVAADDLLGTDYPHLSSMIPTEDSVLVAAAQSREDESGDELLIFKISGM